MAKNNPTPAQRRVLESRGTDLLVSASAGTGKTTTMIGRIVSLLEKGEADISEMVVVTFTNLAAAEMKARLADRLSDIRDNDRIADQLERLDSAAICTLHSFCSELLRNYFYVVDIDPAFVILDSVTVAGLAKNAMDDLFDEYFTKEDRVFGEVYKIFSDKRREDTFRDTLLRLYKFSRCLEDFPSWYAQTRQSFVGEPQNNPLADVVLEDIRQTLQYRESCLTDLLAHANEENCAYADVIEENLQQLSSVPRDDLQQALDALFTLSPKNITKGRGVEPTDFERNIKDNLKQLNDAFGDRLKKYSKLYRGERLSTLWQEMRLSVEHVDKLVELVNRFDELFWAHKQQRGGVDFNDLEQLTLRLLADEEALADIRSRYKLIFVDEYQDTNPVQEAIVNKLAQPGKLFMVGDVKQSIYGFRGCDPTIFAEKSLRYRRTGLGEVVELNDNFRSNTEILAFVNNVFCGLMTEQFGNVDYQNTAQLSGTMPPALYTASVRVDLVQKIKADRLAATEMYDITAPTATEDGVRQGELIASRIRDYVGKAYTDKDGIERKLGYGDVVVLMRSMTDRALDVYNTLVSQDIPVAASFKEESFSSKEVRDIVNLLRAVDNPYNDVYLLGSCLTFGQLSESELVPVRLDTEGRIPFYDRLRAYAENGADRAIASKVQRFLQLLSKVRFYSRGTSVCDTVLKVMELTDYPLLVQSLPNGSLRLGKLYAFADSLRGAAYGQSVERFLSYVDETEEAESSVQNAEDAVRMMTMHASKGLEFPVVIVAGLETLFQFDNYALVCNSKLGVAMDHYDFGTMQSAQTVGAFACDVVNQAKQREEEMRLLYVAMTRAKLALDLVATVDETKLTRLPKQPNRANSHFDWLYRALYNCYQRTNVPGVEINVIGSVPQSESAELALMPLSAIGVEEVQSRLAFRYPHQQDTTLPAKVVSSALDNELITAEEDPSPQVVLCADADRNEVGTAYHKVLQYVDYNASRPEVEECVRGLVAAELVPQHIADKLDVDIVLRTLQNPQLRQLLNGGKVYHELPFMLYAPYNELYMLEDSPARDSVILQGVIDLLVMGKDSATVIDFKYTAHSDRADKRYRAQLNSYRMAVQRICGISNVQCYILSIADNKLIKM